MNDGVRVIIMCKAPVVGAVKTRLSPEYSIAEAAEIHQAMATTVIERAQCLFADVRIACDDVEHPFFDRFSLKKLSQGEGDLGDRMKRLAQQLFHEASGPLLFLGTDSPHMSKSRLREVAEHLLTFDAVVGPVEDGGYDLIAMNAPYGELFQDIRWGSCDVLKQTIQRAQTSGITLKLLDVGFDLDRPEDIRQAAAIWQPSPLRMGKEPGS